jgi:hypothetical protein
MCILLNSVFANIAIVSEFEVSNCSCSLRFIVRHTYAIVHLPADPARRAGRVFILPSLLPSFFRESLLFAGRFVENIPAA